MRPYLPPCEWTLIGDISAAGADLTPLLTAIGENAGKIAANESAITGVAGRVNTAESAIGTLQTKVTTLEDEPRSGLDRDYDECQRDYCRYKSG